MSSGPAVTTLKFLAAWMISPWSRLGSSSFSAVATSLNVIVTCASDAAPRRDRTRPFRISDDAADAAVLEADPCDDVALPQPRAERGEARGGEVQRLRQGEEDTLQNLPAHS